MIIVDTSALLAYLKSEPLAEPCGAVLLSGERLLMSAGTFAEALIVAQGQGLRDDLADIVRDARIEIVPVTTETAHRMARAYARWGRRNHPATLNLGDCFAYALAEEMGAPLLFVGEDFRRTDVRAAV